jgi:uncharacterized cupredoxin-like copper-binding protein
MKHRLLVTVLVIASLALAACGGGDEEEAPAAAAPESITVVMHDIYYGDTNDNATNPPTWTATSGAEVTLNMENAGGLEHNWAIVKPGEEIPEPFVEAEHSGLLLINPGLAPAGETKTATFTAPEPGEYSVICTVAGHYPFMQGRLTVN